MHLRTGTLAVIVDKGWLEVCWLGVIRRVPYELAPQTVTLVVYILPASRWSKYVAHSIASCVRMPWVSRWEV